MAQIKVIFGGCGIKYTDEHGNARHALKTPEDGPFTCDDTQAARLVAAGVAAYVNDLGWMAVDPASLQPNGTPDEQNPAPERATGHLDPEELEKMDYNALKKLAAELGVVPEGKKKDDYIAALSAVEVEAGDEENAGDEDEDNDLPDLNAADPE